MKKVFSFALVLALGALLVSGCQQASSPAPTTQLTAAEAAAGVGMMASFSLGLENILLDGFTSMTAMQVRASAPTTPECGTDGWWSSTQDPWFNGYMTQEAEYNFKIWDASNNPVITPGGLAAIDSLADVSKIELFCTITYTMDGQSFTIKYGASKTDPLVFAGLNTSSKTIDGPIALSGIMEGENIGISLTYDNRSVSTGGYPSGTVDFSISSNGSTVITGNMVFNGTDIATITFLTGVSGTFTVDLDTGNIL